jgi:hypothetical protein
MIVYDLRIETVGAASSESVGLFSTLELAVEYYAGHPVVEPKYAVLIRREVDSPDAVEVYVWDHGFSEAVSP